MDLGKTQNRHLHSSRGIYRVQCTLYTYARTLPTFTNVLCRDMHIIPFYLNVFLMVLILDKGQSEVKFKHRP